MPVSLQSNARKPANGITYSLQVTLYRIYNFILSSLSSFSLSPFTSYFTLSGTD